MSKIISYKGMDKDMKCRGFQYEVGGEYEEPNSRVCSAVFHACEHPLDVLGYYPPGLGSRYFEVEQSGDLDKATDDTKVASTKLKVCGEIGIPGLVKAAVEYAMSRAKPVKGGGHLLRGVPPLPRANVVPPLPRARMGSLLPPAIKVGQRVRSAALSVLWSAKSLTF